MRSESSLRLPIALLLALMALPAFSAAAQPSMTKSFSPVSVALSQKSTLTYTLVQGSGSAGTFVGFTETFPAGLIIATPNNLSTTCDIGGSRGAPGTLTGIAGDNTVALVDAVLPAFSSCTVTVDVISASAGVYATTSGPVTSAQGSSAAASATLTVAGGMNYGISFSPATIVAGGVSTVTFSLDNSSNPSDYSQPRIFISLPAGTVVAPTPNYVETCPVGFGGAPAAGATTVDYLAFGSSVAAGASCTVAFDVTASTPGSVFLNPQLTSFSGGPTLDASATLTVQSSGAFLTKSFGSAAIPGGPVQLSFHLENTLSGDATAIAFTDDLDAALSGLVATGGTQTAVCGDGSMISGTSTLTFTGGTLESGESCTFSVPLAVPVGAVPGAYVNVTSSVTTTLVTVSGGRPPSSSAQTLTPASATLTVAADASGQKLPVFSKRFLTTPAAGGTVDLQYTISHTEGGIDLTGLSFTDDLNAALTGLAAVGLPASDVCGTGSTLSGTTSLSLTGGNVTAGSQCSFTVSLAVPAGAVPGAYTSTSSILAGTMITSAFSVPEAIGALNVAGLEFTKDFTNDPTFRGGTVNLEYTLTNQSASPASGIAFTDNLAEVVSGITAVGAPVAACGGTLSELAPGILLFTGGVLASSASCTIAIPVVIPGNATLGDYTSGTGLLTATIDGNGVSFPAAGAQLSIGTPISIAKDFIDDPVLPGGSATLRFTITNSGADAVTALTFSDELETTLSGLTATALPAGGFCGAGSAISGTSVLTVTGGNIAAMGSCTFDVTVGVPATAVGGSSYTNQTSSLVGTVNGVSVTSDRAVSSLQISAAPPAFSKVFAPDAISVGGTSTLTFTIDNTGNSVDATAAGFTDTLPTGMVVAPTPNASTTCPSGTVTAVAGSGAVSLSGATARSGQTCTVSVDVTVSTADTFVNLTGDLTSSLGNSGTATDNLVSSAGPAFSAGFSQSAIASGGTSRLTFTIDNSSSAAAAGGLAFNHTLPAGLTVASTPNAASTCVVGTFAPAGGASAVAFSGGSLSAGASCALAVDVTATTVGSYSIAGAVLDYSLGQSTAATVAMTVEPPPAFSKSFSPFRQATNTPVTLTFTIDNSASALAASALAFTDNFPAGMVVAATPNNSATCTGGMMSVTGGASSISYAGGTVAAGVTCTVQVDVVATTSGSLVNTTGDLTSSQGNSGTATDTLVGTGFTVTESGGSTAVTEAGGTDDFTVVLSVAPSSDVVLSVSSGDTGEATVSPASLTFTSANWNVAQTVTVTGVDDALLDGTQTTTVTVSVNDGASDDAFDALPDQTVSVTTSDDDAAGFTVTESDGSTAVTEAGGTDDFTVVLTAAPASDVVFSVSSGDTGEATVSPASLTFTSANWNVAQTVTVTGVDDALIDGTQTTTVTVAVNDAASDDAFDPLADQTVSVATSDDDAAGFTIVESGGSTAVTEAGGTDSFTVVLTAAPASDVVFSVSSGDTGEATVSPASLTFTSANWNVAQTVTVTGVDDALIDGTQTTTVTVSVNDAASDNNFDPLADQTVSVTTSDDDAAGFTIVESGGSTAVTEAGGTDSFTVVLTAAPASDVVFSVSSGDTGEATVSPASLTFTSANWNVAQTVTVTGVDDALIDGTQTTTVTVSVNDAASDNNFDPLADQTVSVTTSDDDAAGFTIVESGGSTAVTEAGGTDSFTVVLTAAPSSDVVFSVTSGDTGEATVSPASLTFTSANWNVAQTVTVTGVDDALIDGTQTTTVTLSVNDAASDNNFDPLADQTVSVTTSDDDAAGFTIVESGGSTAVTEAGGTDSFTVVLTAAPASDVVFSVSSGDTGEATVSPASLTFTSVNWNVAQTVTVTGVDDALIDGTQTTSVTVSVNDAASDDAFDPLADQTVSVTTSDDDTAGFTIVESGGSTAVTEAGGTDSFTVVLTAAPASDVVFSVSSGDTGEATVSPASLTFTSANWNVAQTVTVTGVDDALIDGTQTTTVTVSINDAASDNNFDPLADQTVSVTTSDDDAAGFTIVESGGSTAVTEAGGTDSFTVVLTAAPSSDVVFSVTSGDTGEATVSPASLTFTSANWNVAQTVTVSGVDDALIDGTQTTTVTVSVNDAASDNNFDPLADQTVSVTTSDDDTAGFTIVESGGSTAVTEAGGTDSFTVVLTAAPSSDVVFSVTSGDTGEATVSPASLTFTSANWNVAQTVTVTGVDDALIDGTQTTTVTLSVNDAASDNNFDPLADQTVSVTTSDDDAAGFTIVESGGSTAVTEAGGTDSFTVVLTAAPASDVVFSVSSGDTGEATVSPASLTFTSVNWNVAQTVTVTGVDDALIDGTQTTSVTVSVNDAASDDAFDPLADQTVSVTTSDDDTAGFTIVESGGSTAVTEAGGTDSFTVVLTAAPASDVVFSVSSGDTGEATVSPASLTFTSANWNVAQTVTVTGVDDALIDGTQTTTVTVSINDAASDNNFDPLADQTVSVTTSDDDAAGFTIVESGGSTAVTEAGGTDSFTVVLTAAPSSDVVFSVTSGDTGEATVSPASLTFTSANWNVAQTVTVSGVDDALIDGTQTTTVTVSVNDAASDNNFDPLADQTVSVTTSDDDTAGFTIVESGGSTAVTEAGGTDSFTVVLTAAPASDVVFSVSSGDTGEATVSPASLTFTSANWNVAQTVTVTGVDDAFIDGTQTTTVTVSVNDAASDNNFDPLADQTVSVTTSDDDTAGFTVVESAGGTLVTEAGGSDSFTVVLTAAPSSPVQISLLVSDTGEATVLPTSLVFTAANWSVPQTVTVTGVDDAVIDGSQSSSITVAVDDASSDNNFDPLPDQIVVVTTTDDDAAGFTVAESGGSTSVAESGTTDSFTVVLEASPSSDVVITAASSDTGEGTVSPAALTFTAANWNVPQTVTVTGVDDALPDGDQTIQVVLSVDDAASDDAFDVLADQSVAITVIDDGAQVADMAIAITPPAQATAGEQAVFGLSLSNTGPAAAAGASVVLTPGAGVSFVSSTCGIAALTWTAGSIASGGSASCDVTVMIAAGSTGTAALSASVSTTTQDPVAANDSATSTVAIQTSADLVLTQSAPASATPGQTVAFTISVVNDGPSVATGLSIGSTPGTGLTLMSTSGACVSGFPCAVSSLSVGQTATITAVFRVDAAFTGSVSHAADVTASTPDPDATSNAATSSVSTAPSADLAVTATGPSSVNAGGNATYTLRVTNNGPSNAVGVVLASPAPAGITLVSALPGCGTFPCSLGDLAVGQTREVTAVFNAPGTFTGGSFSIAGSASSSVADAVPGNNSASVTTSVVAQADLSLTLSGLIYTSGLAPVSQLSYTVSVTNFGPSAATGVTVSQVFSPSVSVVQPKPGQGVYNTATNVWDIGTLPSGQGVVLEYFIRTSISGDLTATAEVATSSTGDPDSTPGNGVAGEDDLATYTATLRPPVTEVADGDVALPFGTPITFIAGGGSGGSLSADKSGSATARTVLYAASSGSGVFRLREDDSGNRFWEQINPDEQVQVLVTNGLASTGGNRVVVSFAEVGVFESLDEGLTWTNITGSLDPGDVRKLVFVNGSLMAATGSSGVWWYSASGWVNQADGLAGADVRDVASAGGEVYAATWSRGVFRDDVGFWEAMPALPVSQVTSLGAGGRELVAGTWGRGVYRLDGTSWSSVGNGLEEAFVKQVIVTTTTGTSDNLVAVTPEGVFELDADTQNWDPLLTGLTGQDILTTGVVRGSDGSATELHAGTTDEFVISIRDNSGVSDFSTGVWTPAEEQRLDMLVRGLSFTRNGSLYAALQGGGILHASDENSGFVSLNAGLGTRQMTAVRAVPLNPPGAPGEEERLVAGSRAGIYYLDDQNVDGQLAAGDTWTLAGGSSEIDVQALAQAGPTLIAASPNGVWISADLGLSWSSGGLGGVDVRSLTAMAAGGNVFAGTQQDGVLRSVDGGRTWTTTASGVGGPVNAVVSLGTHVFAGTPQGVYVSSDLGTSWSLMSFETLAKDVVSLTAVQPGLIYAGTNFGGAFYLTDTDRDGAFADETWMMDQALGNDILIASVALSRTTQSAFFGSSLGRILRSAQPTGVGIAAEGEIPDGFVLGQNYPNPFNPVTTIPFAMPTSGQVTVTVFDAMGREVAVLTSGVREAGYHSVSWDAAEAPSGVYLYRIQAEGFSQTRRLVLLK